MWVLKYVLYLEILRSGLITVVWEEEENKVLIWWIFLLFLSCLFIYSFYYDFVINKLLWGLFLRSQRNPFMGIHPRHSSESRQESRVNQMGRPVWRHLQVLKIRGCGSAMGKKEKQQQYDLWETQQSDEVRPFLSQHMIRPQSQLQPDLLPHAMFSITDTTTKEKFWNVWMDEDWYINLGRMHVDGEKMKTETANTLNTNTNTTRC